MIGIVVAHGGREPGSHLFADEVAELERRGHLALATDVRMAGRDDEDAEERSFLETVEVQRRALDTLASRGATRFAFYGHSLGAARGAALATLDDRVSAMVLAAIGTGVLSPRIDPLRFAAAPGPARLFQVGLRDPIVSLEGARAVYDATPEPKRWAEYDCDHSVDVHPQARLDRYAFLEEVLS